MKHKYIIFIIVTLILRSSSQAIWLSKDDFMKQYTSNLIKEFPRDINNRQIITKWCKDILNTKLPNNKRQQISGFEYKGTYTSPTQSVIAYITCYPYIDDVIKVFDKKLISSIKQTKYTNIIKDFDAKKCPIETKANNLNTCDISKLITDLSLIVLNDITNIRHGTSRGYLSPNSKDIGYFVAQRFSYATGETMSKTIQEINKDLCKNPKINFFSTSRIQQCGFPYTYAYIIENSNMGKKILNQTTILDGNKLLLNECDNPNNGSNIIGCGINDHQNTQSYAALLYNELWVYQNFISTYQGLLAINDQLVVKERQGLSLQQINLLRSSMINRLNKQEQRISNAVQVSINLISQLEANYWIHIGFKATEEAAIEAMKYIGPYQQVSKYYLGDRLNTQKPSSTKKG